MNDVEFLLDLLTPEQLEELAKRKRATIKQNTVEVKDSGGVVTDNTGKVNTVKKTTKKKATKKTTKRATKKTPVKKKVVKKPKKATAGEKKSNIILPDDKDFNTTPKRVKRSGPTRSKQTRTRKKGNEKGKACRVTELKLGERENNFVGSDDFGGFQEEIKLQKILSKGKTASKRPKKQLLTAYCTRCEYDFEDVDPSMCMKEGSEIVFVCPDCSCRR